MALRVALRAPLGITAADPILLVTQAARVGPVGAGAEPKPPCAVAGNRPYGPFSPRAALDRGVALWKVGQRSFIVRHRRSRAEESLSNTEARMTAAAGG